MDELVVGLVRKAHGLSGEVLVEPLTGDADDVFVVGRVFGVRGGGRAAPSRLTLHSGRLHKSGQLLRFEEVGDRAAAEALCGAALALPVEELRELEPDEYFVHELVGYRVVRAGGAEVGIVAVVYETGAQMLLGIGAGGGEILVPFGRQVVTEVDRKARRIVIDPLPGLLEE